MIDRHEINRLMVLAKLANNLHLSVADVVELLDCDEEYANRTMHDLTLIEAAFWNAITGELDYNILWVE